MKTEDHETLDWVFHHTEIPRIIKRQVQGENLHVAGKGDFQVEWHMAGDLKTLKCMYNISKGGNSKSPCLYCKESAQVMDSKWWKRAPNRDKVDPDFKAILDIPLCNVHICTLHGLCRIIEKLVFLYIGFAWKLRPEKNRKDALQALEKVLSDIGLHGGDVHITKDFKKSTNGKEVPIKPSIGGVKARRFLSRPKHSGKQVRQGRIVSRINYGLWKQVHNAVKDHEADGEARNVKAEVWRSLDQLFMFCDNVTWTKSDYKNFEEAIKHFGKSMKDAWTACNITHYMVRFCLLLLLKCAPLFFLNNLLCILMSP